MIKAMKSQIGKGTSLEYTTRKRYRGEPICADPTADPRENETALHFTMGDRRLWISSYEPVVIAGLLAHPDFQIGHLVLMRANGRECVVGVVGKLPVGVLSIGRARKSDSHELIAPNKARPTVTHAIYAKETRARKPKKSERKKKEQLDLSPKRGRSRVQKSPKERATARSASRKLSARAK